MTIRQILSAHIELTVLVFLFVFGCFMLAFFPNREEMSRFIENGAILGILARAFGTKSDDQKTADPTKEESRSSKKT